MARVTGSHGAKGIPGGKAIANQLDQIAGQGGVSGFHARLSYLTKSMAGQQALIDAGIDLTNPDKRRRVQGWLSDPDHQAGVGVSHASVRKVDTAYAARRRVTLAASLTARLEANGGTRIEIHPVDQSAVPGAIQRTLNVRNINIRHWADLVDAWKAGSDLEAEWETMAQENIGSDWAAYALVAHIGFSA